MKSHFTPKPGYNRAAADGIVREATTVLSERASWFLWEASGLEQLRGLQYQRCRCLVLARLIEECPECPSAEDNFPDADYCRGCPADDCGTPVPASEVLRAVVNDLERERLLRRVPAP